jgi:hypothetical protein
MERVAYLRCGFRRTVEARVDGEIGLWDLGCIELSGGEQTNESRSFRFASLRSG